MTVYIEKSGDLVGCYHSGTDGQTTEQGEIELLSQWTIDDWDEQYGNQWRREPKFALDILWNMFTGKFTLVAQWLANLRLDCPALTLVVSWANSKQIPFIECSTTYLQNTAKLMKVKHEKDWRERQRRVENVTDHIIIVTWKILWDILEYYSQNAIDIIHYIPNLFIILWWKRKGEAASTAVSITSLFA